MQDAFALQPRVEVGDVDVESAPLVGCSGDRAGQLFLAELGGDADDLAPLNVGAVDGELGEYTEAVVRHGRRS